MCFIYYCNCDSTTDASRAVCLPPDSHLMWFIYFWSVRAVALALLSPLPTPLSLSYVCFSGPRFVSCLCVCGVSVCAN